MLIYLKVVLFFYMKYIDLKLGGGGDVLRWVPGTQDVDVILRVKLRPNVNYEGPSGLLHPPLSIPGDHMGFLLRLDNVPHYP